MGTTTNEKEIPQSHQNESKLRANFTNLIILIE